MRVVVLGLMLSACATPASRERASLPAPANDTDVVLLHVTQLRRSAGEEDPILLKQLASDAVDAARDIEGGASPQLAGNRAAQRAAERTGVRVVVFVGGLRGVRLPDELLHRPQLFLAASAARAPDGRAIGVLLVASDVTSNP